MSDASVLEGGGHGNGDLLGQLLKLDDFRGDFHSGSMCALAHKSSVALCALAQSVRARLHAQPWAMGTQPKSAAVQEYRRRIAAYLEMVQVAHGWGQAKMGEMAGGLAHTTIGRALKGEHTIGFPALLALEDASRVPIPDSLRAAAIAAQQPTRREPDLLADITAVRAQINDLPESERKALLEELQKALVKAS